MLYRIVSVTNVDGSEKTNEPHIHMAGKVGYMPPELVMNTERLVFQYYDPDRKADRTLVTTPVEEVYENEDGSFTIITLNSIYTLEYVGDC